MNDKSLTEQFRERMELRKLEDPRVEAMVADVRLIRTEIRGLNKIGNLALGNSRDAVDHVKAMQEIIVIQADTITGIQNELISVRAELSTAQ